MQAVGWAETARAPGARVSLESDPPREAAISEMVGRLVDEYLGHESTTHTYINGDVITVVLEDSLTKGEERLTRDGKAELVLRMRSAFQESLREDLISRVEGMTGRAVRLNANQMATDITVEVLVLDGACGVERAADHR